MKVINYGPGYQPKRLVCASCQSELEYDTRDRKFDSHLVADKTDTSKLKQIVGVYVQCPVCSYMNALEETEFPYTPEKPKKRKWFSRKEK